MKKIAILAAFPLHSLKAFGEEFRPKGHYATWLPQIAEAWENQKEFEIHWIVLSDLVVERRDVRELGQVFHVLPTSPTGRAATFYRGDRAAIGRVLNEIQADVVHGWGSEDVYGLAAALSGRPNLVSMQGILSYYALKNKMPARSYWQAMLEIFVLWKARRLTTESEWGRKVVRGRNPYARVDIVEYGVQDIFFETEWKPEREKPHAIFVGSITPRKGIQDLVRAFRDPGLSGFHLNVVGGEDGQWSAELKKSAPHNIHWLGRKTTEETAQLMAKAWCLVLPTRADTSPNVVKEARVIGLPIITTREGGQTSYVKDEEDGYFVGCGDVDGMAKRLRSVLGSFSQAQTMGGLGKRRYRDMFLAKQTSESFILIYRAAAGG